LKEELAASATEASALTDAAAAAAVQQAQTKKQDMENKAAEADIATETARKGEEISLWLQQWRQQQR